MKMNSDLPVPTDAELLRKFAEGDREEAFAELVRRHVNLVHSAALRLLNGDSAAAGDVTQSVFIELARRATSLTTHPALVGWLYTVTHRQAAHWIRTETRRERREKEAHEMHTMNHPSEPEADWSRVKPVLDAAMLELGEPDRLVLLLRHFERRSHAEVGQRLGLGENAARMRCDRALQRLADRLARRGITSTGSALALTLGGWSVTAAPAGLAAQITAGALAAAAATGTPLGILTFMASSKVKLAAVAAGFGLLGTGIVVQHEGTLRLQQERDALASQLAARPANAQEFRPDPQGTTSSQAAAQASLAELLQLRAEVARLRREIAARPIPSASSGRAPATAPEAKPVWAAGEFLAQESWGDFGTETPLSAVATQLWTLRHGHLDRLAEISNMNPTALERLRSLPPGTLVETLGMGRVTGAKLIETRETGPDAFEVYYEASWDGDLPAGMSSGINRVQAVRSGNGWKILLPPPLGEKPGSGQ